MPTQNDPLPPALVDLLKNMPAGATLELTKLPTGEIVVTEEAPKRTKAEMLEEYAHLRGRGITITDAAERYGVPRGPIDSWVYRSRDVSFVDESSYPKLVDEAEIALCAKIYHERKAAGITGVPYFNPDGTEYEIKHPHRSRRLKAA